MIIIAIIINSIPSAYPSSLSRQKKKKIFAHGEVLSLVFPTSYPPIP